LVNVQEVLSGDTGGINIRRGHMIGKYGALTKSNPARSERDRTIATERLKGRTYGEFAKQFGLSKSTLHNILTADEIRDIIETGTMEIMSLVPKAVDNYQKLLDSKDEKIRLQASKETLQISGVMPSHTVSSVVVNVLNQNTDHAVTEELQQLKAFLEQRCSNVIDVGPGEAET
jgi:hypothetical protein